MPITKIVMFRTNETVQEREDSDEGESLIVFPEAWNCGIPFREKGYGIAWGAREMKRPPEGGLCAES